VPLIPILGIAFCFLLMFSLPVDNWLRLIVWLLLGLAVYFAYGRQHSVLARMQNAPEQATSRSF
jgi:APA family basic amino acid/polyamine antiporter